MSVNMLNERVLEIECWRWLPTAERKVEMAESSKMGRKMNIAKSISIPKSMSSLTNPLRNRNRSSRKGSMSTNTTATLSEVDDEQQETSFLGRRRGSISGGKGGGNLTVVEGEEWEGGGKTEEEKPVRRETSNILKRFTNKHHSSSPSNVANTLSTSTSSAPRPSLSKSSSNYSLAGKGRSGDATPNGDAKQDQRAMLGLDAEIRNLDLEESRNANGNGSASGGRKGSTRPSKRRTEREMEDEAEKAWKRVRLVLKGDLLGENLGRHMAGRTTDGKDEQEESVVLVEVYEDTNPIPTYSFDPTKISSTDMRLPHPSLHPDRHDKVIHFRKLDKSTIDHQRKDSTSTAASRTGAVNLNDGESLDEHDRYKHRELAELSKMMMQRSIPEGVVVIPPRQDSLSSPEISSPGSVSGSEVWSTPLLSPAFSESGRVGSYNAGWPTRGGAIAQPPVRTPARPDFGFGRTSSAQEVVKSKPKFKSAATDGYFTQTVSLPGTYPEETSPTTPLAELPGEDTGVNPARHATPRAGLTRSTRSTASLRTNNSTSMSEASDDTWVSASLSFTDEFAETGESASRWRSAGASDGKNGRAALGLGRRSETGSGRWNGATSTAKPSMESERIDLAKYAGKMGKSGTLLGLYEISGTDELVLGFDDRTDTLKWFSLLRSFTSPELATIIAAPSPLLRTTSPPRARPSTSPISPTLSVASQKSDQADWARMWRSLEIDIQDVRNLAVLRPDAEVDEVDRRKRGMFRSISTGIGQTFKSMKDETGEGLLEADQLFWTITLDEDVLAQTPFRAIDTKSWSESIKLEEIPEWAKCTLQLNRTSRLAQDAADSIPIASVRINSRDLEHGVWNERKMDLLWPNSDKIAGQVRVRCRADDILVRGVAKYRSVAEDLQSGDPARIAELALIANADGGAVSLCRLGLVKGLVEPMLCALIDAEAQGPAATLFRLNTPLTRCMEYIVRVFALDYVQETIGKDIKKICMMGPVIGTHDDVQKILRYKVSHVWNKLYNSRSHFPSKLRWLFSYLVTAVARHHPTSKILQLQSVSAFLFLRLIGPCIMGPERFGIIDHHPSPDTQKTLKLIAKPLVNLGFLTEPKSEQDCNMEAILSNSFGKENRTTMVDYLIACSTIDPSYMLDPPSNHDLIDLIMDSRQESSSSAPFPAVVPIGTSSILVDTNKELAWLARIQQQRAEPPQGRAPSFNFSMPTRHIGHSPLLSQGADHPPRPPTSFPSQTLSAPPPSRIRSASAQNLRTSRSSSSNHSHNNASSLLSSNSNSNSNTSLGPPPEIGRRTSSVNGSTPIPSIRLISGGPQNGTASGVVSGAVVNVNGRGV